jgi:hypothetical protein
MGNSDTSLTAEPLNLLCRINSQTGTPIWATALVLVSSLPLAVLTDLPPLIDMVSPRNMEFHIQQLPGWMSGLTSTWTD